MKTLFVNACVRAESRTRGLAEYFLEKMGGDVETVDLARAEILPLNGERLQKRDEMLKNGELDGEMLAYARQFAQAENIVVAAPYWDLGFPALLKVYLENITAAGVTFRYESGVPKGLCCGKRLIYITTSGGPVFADFGFSYVKALAEGFYGIKETVCFRGERLDMDPAKAEDVLAQVRSQMDEYAAAGKIC